jgi:hypothetical protein
MSMIIDGTNGLTFNNATTQASAGSVLQVVNALSNTYTTTTSTSFTTIITATITPKFSTSKILILCSASGLTGYINTSLNDNAGTVLAYPAQSGSNVVYTSGSLSFSHSPATTSAYSYTLRFASTSAGNTARINDYASSPTTSTITLMEIAA